MKYRGVVPALLIVRESRFLARVLLEGREVKVHVKNTGRCRELLVPGAEVYLEPSANPARQTAYSLVAVRQGARVVNIDSQAPNEVVHEELVRENGWLAEWLQAGGTGSAPLQSASPQRILPQGRPLVRREVRFGSSRIDFCAEWPDGSRTFIEVKGVTLEQGAHAEFPDAPTARGARHLEELAAAVREGYSACVLFVIQMEGVSSFSPCRRIDPAFADALSRAAAGGVTIAACDCRVTPGEIRLNRPVPVTGLTHDP